MAQASLLTRTDQAIDHPGGPDLAALSAIVKDIEKIPDTSLEKRPLLPLAWCIARDHLAKDSQYAAQVAHTAHNSLWFMPETERPNALITILDYAENIGPTNPVEAITLARTPVNSQFSSDINKRAVGIILKSVPADEDKQPIEGLDPAVFAAARDIVRATRLNTTEAVTLFIKYGEILFKKDPATVVSGEPLLQHYRSALSNIAHNPVEQKRLLTAWSNLMDHMATYDLDRALSIEATEADNSFHHGAKPPLMDTAADCFDRHFDLLAAQDLKTAYGKGTRVLRPQPGKPLEDIIHRIYMEHGEAHIKQKPSAIAVKALLEGAYHFSAQGQRSSEINNLLREHMSVFQSYCDKQAQGNLSSTMAALHKAHALEQPVIAAFLQVTPAWQNRSPDFVRGMLAHIAEQLSAPGSAEETIATRQWSSLVKARNTPTGVLQAVHQASPEGRSFRSTVAGVLSSRGAPLGPPSRGDVASYIGRRFASTGAAPK